MSHLDDERVARLAASGQIPEEAGQDSAHVASCKACALKVQQAREALMGQRAPPASAAPLEGPLREEAKPPPEAGLPRGTPVGRYFVLQEVGRGGMGVVYAAFDPELDRKVALKLLRVRRGGRDADNQARLLREAQAMARISHPNVTAIHDAGTYGDRVFLAMELVQGGVTLRTWLKKKPRSWRETLNVMVEAGKGLAAAHRAGLVHRDFKLENVLVGRNGRVQVSDFGLALLVRADSGAMTPGASAGDESSDSQSDAASSRLRNHITLAGRRVGTPTYMSPEQFQGRSPDTRSDQFSYCVTLYRALFGQKPFDAKKMAQAARQGPEAIARVVSPPPRQPRVPGWLRRTVMRGLSPLPEQRFASMDELLERLSRPPARARTGGAAVLAIVTVCALVFVWREVAARKSALCGGAAQQLEGVWEGKVREQVRAAFQASGQPQAAVLFERVRAGLDEYTAAWVAMHTDTCQATRLRGEQSEELLTLRMACLGRRLAAARTLTQLLTSADARMVEDAPDVASNLEPVSDCADVAALTAPVPLPRSPAARAEAERLSAELARGEVLRLSGRYNEALKVFAHAVEGARQLDYPALLAEALEDQAYLLNGMGRTDEVEPLIRQAWRAAELGHRDDIRVLVAKQFMFLLLRRALPEEAIHWGEMGEAALERLGRPAKLEVRLRLTFGVAYHSAGRFEEAKSQFDRALAASQHIQSPMTRSSLLNNLAPTEDALGHHAEALAAIKEALEIAQRERLPGSVEVAVMRSTYAELLTRNGEFTQAEPLAQQALATFDTVLGPSHPDSNTTAEVLATALLGEGRASEALPHAQRAVQAVEKAHGPQHPELASPLSTLGAVLMALNQPAQSLPLLERALTLNNPEPLLLAHLRFRLACTLALAGKDKPRARTLAQQALESFRHLNYPAQVARVSQWLQQHPM